VQDIDVHGEFEKRVVTLLVMSAFSNFPGASRACALIMPLAPVMLQDLREYKHIAVDQKFVPASIFG